MNDDDRTDDGSPQTDEALEDGFERSAPQGTLRWDFEAALRRLQDGGERLPRPKPWYGLPGDLWERGRVTKAGERVVGDVLQVTANLLADDTRTAIGEASRASADATWDVVRLLAARVERLERHASGFDLPTALVPVPIPDASEWSADLPTWMTADGAAAGLPVLVGEAATDSVVAAMVAADQRHRPVIVVDPRGKRVAAASAVAESAGRTVEVVLSEVADDLSRRPAASLGGVLLIGAVDRLDQGGKADLVDQALRCLAPGGALVVLTMDEREWTASLGPLAADLSSGRPFHPETWAQVLVRRPMRSVSSVEVHRAGVGPVHAIVARVGR